MDKKVKIQRTEESSYSSSSYEEKGEKGKIIVKSDAEKRLLRKLNLRLLPLAMLILFLQLLDKTILSTASVLGMLEDTNLSNTDYSMLGAIFYVGYLVYQLPNSYLLQKLPVGKYLGVLLICWGTVTIATAFGKNFHQLVVLRVLLGLFESGSYPALLLILHTMYRRSEQSACFGFICLGNGLATVISPGIFVGIAKMGTVYGIKPWQWCYIIWGVVTVVSGIIVFIFLIDNPGSWVLNLTEEEKIIVEERTRDNAVVRKQTVEFSQYWEALKEPRCWLIFVAMTAHCLQSGGLMIYSAILIKSFGFSSNEAILLNIPFGFLAIFFTFAVIAMDLRTKQMVYTTVFFYIFCATGYLLLAVLPHTAVKLVGFYLCSATNASYVMLFSIIGVTVSGYSKKIFYNAVLMLGFTVGNFCGPLIFADNDKHISAMWGLFAGNSLCIICVLTIRFIHVRLNKKRAPFRTSEATDIYLNLTDKQDKNFIYLL